MKYKLFKMPKLKVIVKEGEKHLWKLFHSSHYMTFNQPVEKTLPSSSKFYTYYWLKEDNGKIEEVLVGCVAVLFQIHKYYNARRLSRLVVLPEFQGMGFGRIIIDSISEFYKQKNIKMFISTFHNKLGYYLEKSELWQPTFGNKRKLPQKADEDRTKGFKSLRKEDILFRYNYIGNNFKKNYKIKLNKSKDPFILIDLRKQLKNEKDKNKRKILRNKIKEFEKS